MNYITEIKAFYDIVQVKQLSQGQISLWHALMFINNKCAWVEWFSVPNIMLEIHTGLSRQAIIKARNVLKMYGLIDFKTNGTKATNYKMIPMSKSLQVGCQDSLQDSLQIGSTLNKQNKTKLKEKSNKRESTPPTLEEVQAYIKDKRLNVNAQKFFDYYEATGWKDSKGNKVKSWKRQTSSVEWLPKRR